ncbi:MAG TPA: hypothetical protein VLY24_29005 [Bryobacteraceae bacterium]|nr:hypothetical protein [Bryobacteraceae bacterium]
MKRLLLSILFIGPLAFGSTQSLALNSASFTGTYTIPNSAPYNQIGSYYMDIRLWGWNYPTACASVVSTIHSTLYPSIRLCNGALFIFSGPDPTVGNYSVVVNAPNIAVTSISSTNPAVLTLAATPFRLSMRAGSVIALQGVAGTGCASLNANQTITAVSGNAVTISADATACSYTASSGKAYSTDIVARFRRDLSAMQSSVEVWDIGGEGYQAGVVGLTAQYNFTLPQTLAVGNGNQVLPANIGFFRWYSSLVPIGSASPHPSAATADLLDWEFEGNGNDSSSHGLNISWAGSAAYVTDPSYPPACNTGAQQVFRAGFPATLNGSGSFPLDGGTFLSYLWQAIPSTLSDIRLQRLRWSSHAVANPTVTGTVFGPLNFHLTVAQSDGQSSTCMVHDGAVATDGNGTVITATGNSALDGGIATLIGPQVQFNKNPWIYYDQAAAWDAAAEIADMDVDYPDVWDIAGQGTVTVSSGSNIVTGSGTTFTTTFCQGPSNPTVPQVIGGNGVGIDIWYLTGRVFNGIPETGRRVLFVTSCQSDTQLTTQYAYNGGTLIGSTTYPAGSDLQYSLFGHTSWDSNIYPGNFYDGVQAYYELYYRSGIDTYLIAARKWADRFWTSPQVDRGMSYSSGTSFTWAGPGRPNSVSGLVLRAMDTGDGHPDMWAGLRNYWMFSKHIMDLYIAWVHLPQTLGGNGTGTDPREYGYTLAQLAYGAMFDPDPTWQAYCRAEIEASFNASTGLWPRAIDPVQNTWLQWYSGKSTFDYTQPSPPAWSNSTATLTSGSTVVSCTATNCGWTAADFVKYLWGTSTTCSSGNACATAPVIFTDSATFPYDSSHTDSVAYCYPNPCTFIDSNHFTLDRPYQGTTGIHGWAFGVNGGIGNALVAGWGNVPYMEGILAWAFSLAGKAMACIASGVPANCDNATSALANSYVQMQANWITTNGYLPTYFGVAYLGGFPVCGSNVNPSNVWCNQGYTNLQSREMGGDTYRGLAAAYTASPTSTLGNLLDNWYSGMWAKPGTNPLIQSPDGQYDFNFDGSGCSGCGGYLTGPALSMKEFGQHFGISDQAGWPALRIGGVQSPRLMSVYVSGRIEDVPGSVAMQVTVTESTGIVDPPVVCSSSPCAITVNQVAGNPVIQLSYLSAHGEILATGQPFTVTVN